MYNGGDYIVHTSLIWLLFSSLLHQTTYTTHMIHIQGITKNFGSLQVLKGIDFSMPFGIVWSGLNDTLLQKYVQDSAHLWQGYTEHVPAHAMGSTIGTHVGPGAIGVAFFEK